jgi:HD-GYP domain-containing protein (c-di-GMP phosphodiesterase class II)
MNKALTFLLTLVCATVCAAEPAIDQHAQAAVSAASQVTSVFPSETERSEERTRLSAKRQALEDQYKQDMQQCYQNFDVTSCRLKARDRRIEANALLRKEELRFNAQERQIHALDARRNLEERNSEAEQKKAEAERAAAIATSKDRGDANKQKQIDHALQGTKRGEYEQKQREAQQHREDAAKKLRERTKEPAAPLPALGK